MKTENINPIRPPGVHFASYVCEDTGEVTRFYLRTHEEIDFEIDREISVESNKKRIEKLGAKRARFHATLDAKASAAASA